ncbi:hypothetical protein CPB84DRAFT_1775613, partial [Gymnopilus junonius]
EAVDSDTTQRCTPADQKKAAEGTHHRTDLAVAGTAAAGFVKEAPGRILQIGSTAVFVATHSHKNSAAQAGANSPAVVATMTARAVESFTAS